MNIYWTCLASLGLGVLIYIAITLSVMAHCVVEIHRKLFEDKK